jgi:hypothetical protein
MNIPDFKNFEPFNNLRALMNASLIEGFTLSDPSALSMADFEVMRTTGKDVNLSELKVLNDGTLSYKNTRVLLHIRDIAIYGDREDRNTLPKFHISDCSTLKNMRENNRFNRYVISIRVDGKFTINFIKNNKEITEIKPLNVCMNCLELLSYKNFTNNSEKRKIRDNFSIKEFFTLYPRTLIKAKPSHTSATAPINKYPKEIEKISYEYRESRNFICESCKINLNKKELRKFLHTNHKNGSKYDCKSSNLEALCIYCHANKPFHAHMKNLNEYKVFLGIRSSLLNYNDFIKSTPHENLNFTVKNHESHTSLSQDNIFNEANNIALNNGLKKEDFRSKNGAFWILLKENTGEISNKLRSLGFQYKSSRGWWRK